jgi:hypothetical protein
MIFYKSHYTFYAKYYISLIKIVKFLVKIVFAKLSIQLFSIQLFNNYFTIDLQLSSYDDILSLHFLIN